MGSSRAERRMVRWESLKHANGKRSVTSGISRRRRGDSLRAQRSESAMFLHQYVITFGEY